MNPEPPVIRISDGAPKLTLRPGIAEIRTAKGLQRVPLHAIAADPAKPVAFRKDERYAVWDARGLTVRGKHGTVTTRLEGYATSPRLFGKDAIRANVAAFRKGGRRKGANALSGAARLGSKVYFLPRWTANGSTWLEALVRVDLDAADPRPELLGRFPGLTSARRPDDHQLAVVNARLMTVVRKDDSWGIAAYAPVAKEFGYVPMGDRLLWLAGSIYAEGTKYGATVVGALDRRTLMHEVRLEVRAEAVEPLGPEGRLLRIRRKDETTFADAMTGAMFTIPQNASARPVTVNGAPALLVWDAERAPTRGWLLSPGPTWRVLARWTSNAAVTES